MAARTSNEPRSRHGAGNGPVGDSHEPLGIARVEDSRHRGRYGSQYLPPAPGSLWPSAGRWWEGSLQH